MRRGSGIRRGVSVYIMLMGNYSAGKMRDAVGVCVWGSYVCSARGWDDAGLGGIFSCDSV